MLIELGGSYYINNQKKFRRNVYIEETERESKIKDFKFDTFECVYKYTSTEVDTCDIIGDFYLDLDYSIHTDEDYNLVKKEALIILNTLNFIYEIPFDYIKIFFSGNKGFHILIDYNVFGIMPNLQLNLYYKCIAKYLNTFTTHKLIDTAIYDRKRLFRIPNTVNTSTGLYKVQITKDMLRNFDRDQMIQYASKPKDLIDTKTEYLPKAQSILRQAVDTVHHKETKIRKKKNTNKIKGNSNLEILPCIKEILDSDITSGSRNNTFAIVSSSLFQSGKNNEEVADILFAWNNTLSEPLEEREVRTTILSTYSGFLSDKCYGCQSIKDMGYCLNECSLNNKGGF